MDNVRDALLRMYRVAKMAKRYDEVFEGFDTPYFRIYGEAVDAIYALIGEHTESLEESVTYHVVNATDLTDNRAAEVLMAEFGRNNTQPEPQVKWPDSMENMVASNGGYLPKQQNGGHLRETPEGDWQ